MAKCSKIRHIVWLRQMLRRWRLRASRAASDVPAGHVAVCVGSSSRRFVVRASHLNHPVFKQLLQQAEDEYGFSSRSAGPLSLPSCDESLFEDILQHISSSSSSSARLEDFRRVRSSCCCCQVGRWHAAEALPLLRGFAEKPAVW